MSIIKALKKLDKLSVQELRHFIQIADTYIQNYKAAISNYPKDRMEKCGIPYLASLTRDKEAFENELKKR